MGKKVKVYFRRLPNDAENGTIYSKKIRPNDPCPCGSGKKAKKCCGTERSYLYNKHVNYVMREEGLSEPELYKIRRSKKGEVTKTSRFCYEIDQAVVANDTFEDESKRGKVATVLGRGVDHDNLDPYYEIMFCEEDDRYGKWVAEGHLSPFIR